MSKTFLGRNTQRIFFIIFTVLAKIQEIFLPDCVFQNMEKRNIITVITMFSYLLLASGFAHGLATRNSFITVKNLPCKICFEKLLWDSALTLVHIAVKGHFLPLILVFWEVIASVPGSYWTYFIK